MINAFLKYLAGIINGIFNFMGSITIPGETTITILAVTMVFVFVEFSLALIDR